MGMGWTDERTEDLKKLWQDGLSASEISKQLGGTTRNAVIGKVHRLGLSGRAPPSKPARPVFKAPVRRREPAPVRRIIAPIPTSEQPLEPESLPAYSEEEVSCSTAVLQLGAHMCKWPIGDPCTDGFAFCGRHTASGAPYCSEHAQVAYQPKGTKKKTNANDLARSLRRYI